MEYNANTRVYMDVNSDYLEIKIFRKQRRKERMHYKRNRSFKIYPTHIHNQWHPVSDLP